MAFLESEIGENTLNSITVGATIPNISVSNLKNIRIPLPPITEQNVIATKFLNKLEEIQALNIKLEIAKKSLKEVF
jgi:restriction endonuclease S subunit